MGDSRDPKDQLVKMDHVDVSEQKDQSGPLENKDLKDLREASDLKDYQVKMESLDLKDHQDLQGHPDHQHQLSFHHFHQMSNRQSMEMDTDITRVRKETHSKTTRN